MTDNIHSGTISELRQALRARRRVLVDQIHHQIRDVRSEATETCHQSNNPDEPSELESTGDVAFALIQLKSQVLDRINAALKRIDEGTYGNCIDCEGAISPVRLRAVPFATRCLACEDRREQADRERRIRAQRAAEGSPAIIVRH